MEVDRELSFVKGGKALDIQDPVPVSRSTVATPRAARAADFLSDKFKLWFGKSELKYNDTKRPIPFFHGSVTFGITDPVNGDSQNWTFDDKRLGKHTGSPMAALGHFFTRDRDEASGYSRGTGNVKGVLFQDGAAESYGVVATVGI